MTHCGKWGVGEEEEEDLILKRKEMFGFFFVTPNVVQVYADCPFPVQCECEQRGNITKKNEPRKRIQLATCQL